MTLSSDSRRGSTGVPPAAEGVSPSGSSIVQLQISTHTDDRPTILTGHRAATESSAIVMGQTLGHYELIEPIGRGGMATVFKARDRELGRIVALKILPPESAADAETVNRFKQEGRAAARLDHDHIARVYFCGEDRGLHFIAFEFIEGDNLRQVLARQHRLAIPEAVRYLAQVTAGLKHAAERGVVHRDIKPGNIIITPDGQAKIVDMGLARHLGSHSVNGGVTQSGVTLGTFDYISPEQALDPRQADVRSDIYSLGCTFYHALTGRPPVPEGTAARKLQAHQNEAPLDPRDLNADVPDALAAVLARMMAKDPARRPQTAAELLRDIAAVAFQCKIPMDGLALDVTAETPRMTPPQRSSPWPWILAGMAAIVLIVSLSIPRRPAAIMAPPWGDTASVSRPIVEPILPNTAAVADPAMRTILTAVDLAAACRQSDSVKLRLQSGTTYDFTALPESVLFQGQSITLEADTATGAAPPIIRLAAATRDDDRDRTPGAFTLRGCREVKFVGVTFLVTAAAADAPAMTTAAAILFDKVDTVAIDGCRFTIDADVRDDQIAGLAMIASGTLSAKHTLFRFGDHNVAIALRDTAGVTLDECAFAPHRAAIDIGAAAGDVANGPAIAFRRSTVMIDHCGTAVRSAAVAKVTAGFSVFAGFEAADLPHGNVIAGENDGKAIIWETEADHPNAFYHVTMPAETDGIHRVLKRSPWALPDPKALLNGSNPAAAFRLSLTDPKLRLPAASGAVIVGVKALGHPEARIYSGAWPPERPAMVKAAANERIVWPDADADDNAQRVYATFNAAYAALLPGETLSLAVNGPLRLPPLAEKTLKATIRAAAGFHPVLVPDGDGFTVDATLFKLADGEITFENLGFDLKDRQSIVSAAGGTVCTFRGCLITLAEKDNHPAAAVVIPDPSREMRAAGSSDDGPRITFENSILRGDGRGVWVHSARPFECTFTNTALALDGSAIVIDAADKAPGTESPKAVVKLRRVTAVLTGPLVELKTGRSTGGTAGHITLDAEGCLFAAADSRSTAISLILLDDADATADLARYVAWGGRGSVYAFSDNAPAVEWRGVNNAMAGSWDWPAWLRFSRDDGRHLAKVRFAKGNFKTKLLTATAADFELASFGTIDAGVDAKKLPNE